MIAAGLVVMCVGVALYVTWPVFRPGHANPTLPVHRLEPPPREGEGDQGRREAE